MTRRFGSKISIISFLLFVVAGFFMPDMAFSQVDQVSLRKIYFDTRGEPVNVYPKPIRAKDLDIIDTGSVTYLYVDTGQGLAVYDVAAANNTSPFPGTGIGFERVTPVNWIPVADGYQSDTEDPSLSHALTPDGNTLAYAWRVGDYGLKIFDTTDKANPLQIINSLNTGPLTKVRTFAVGGSNYAIGKGNGMVIVDITGRNNPVLRSTIPEWPLDFAVRYPYVYMASGTAGLKVYNIQNVNFPFEVALTPSVAFGNSRGVAADGQYIYVARLGGVLEVWKADFTVGTLTRWGTYTNPKIQTNRVNADYPYIYLSGACTGFEVVDASPLFNIKRVYSSSGSCGTPDPDLDQYDMRTIVDPNGGYFYRAAHGLLASYTITAAASDLNQDELTNASGVDTFQRE